MKTKRILSGILAAAMMLCLAGCGESDPPESTDLPKKTSVATSVNTPESTPDNGEAAVYKLPAGAQSEYALYKTVLNFLNNGFHYEDLQTVYDQNLFLAFFSKQTSKPEENFTLGMQYDESCALIARLLEKASKMDLSLDAIDYDAFQSEFPESMREQIRDHHEAFERFIDGFVIQVVEYGIGRDGENPFSSGQTSWEEKSAGELVITEYEDYDAYDNDLYINFPRVYVMDFGKYSSGNTTYYTAVYYTKINNRYYFIGFYSIRESEGSAGG